MHLDLDARQRVEVLFVLAIAVWSLAQGRVDGRLWRCASPAARTAAAK
jgi:hypothetical protein